MKFSRHFKISSSILTGSGFAAVAVTGALHWFSVLLFFSALIVSCFIDTARMRKRIPLWLLNCLGIVLALVFAAETLLLSRPLMEASLHLLTFGAVLKLLTLSRGRDYFFLHLISFALLVTGSALTVNAAFGICFLVFLFSAIHTCILFEIQRSDTGMGISRASAAEQRPGSATDRPATVPKGILFATTASTTLLILALAIPLFLLLPRSASGFHRQPSGKTQLVSGFSDSVELGRGGAIRLSDAIVMRVRTSRPPSELPPDIKWRGMALDHFDGRVWTRSNPVQHPVPIKEGHFKLEDSAIGTDWLHQTFFLESLSTNVVFAARKVLAVSRDPGILVRDSEENLYTGLRDQRKLRYEAVSDLSRPNPSYFSDAGDIPPEVRETCLQLPFIDGKIKALAQQATAVPGNSYEKAKNMERFLKTRYTYSLELAATPVKKDPLAMFLFETRKGHCEYFASAMAIMLRYVGIPSRLVNGFRSGEYNRIGEDWIVRQYHAHSWVEAYLPPYGWVEFDPTPASPPSPRPALSRFWTGLTDAAELWWWERVINYDSLGQKKVVVSIYSSAGSFLNSVSEFSNNAYQRGLEGIAWIGSPEAVRTLGKRWYWGIPVLILFALWIGPLRTRIRRGLRPVLYRNKPQQYAGSFYAEALKMLSKHGMVKPAAHTPMEFARNLAGHPAGVPLLALTRLYNAARFGPPESVSHISEADTLLDSLRQSVKQASAVSNQFSGKHIRIPES